MSNPHVQQLLQLRLVTEDGDLISKAYRDDLVKSGLAQRHRGHNWITPKGLDYIIDLYLYE